MEIKIKYTDGTDETVHSATDARSKSELKEQLNANAEIKTLFESAIIKYDDWTTGSGKKVTGSVVTVKSFDELISHLGAYGG